jgi:hypothetical protein
MEWLILILAVVFYGFFERLNSLSDIKNNDKKNKLSFMKLLKALKIHLSGFTGSFEKIVEASNAAAQNDSDKAKLLNWQLDNEAKHRDREISELLSPDPMRKSAYNHSLNWSNISEANDSYSENSPQKKQGDAYERLIGILLEINGYLVIYNGLIRGYADLGVDIVAISEEKKEVLIIQCKNWNRYTLSIDNLENIYLKLRKFFTTDYFDLPPALIMQSHQVSRFSEESIVNIIRKSKGYTSSWILCMNSKDVIDLDVKQNLGRSFETNFNGIECEKFTYRSNLNLIILPKKIISDKLITDFLNS